jgi:hypothetical protein
MNVVQLNTGLFPDAQTVIASLRQVVAHRVDIIDIRSRDMQEGDWDRVIAAILGADLVVST